ncbi:MAG: DUF4317 domain-containing protein [Lachnospiraceae bacterium]|nr:DUF4317 domain-containing protein [Lachnospiraceae bacterium]
MNKKEISEIKKLLTPEHAVITRICGCYVDGEKEIKFTSKDAFHSLSEEEAFKYFDIFRHTLSGTLGKNLMNMEFPLAEEAEGGRQEFLLKLRDSKLEDDSLLEEFYQNVIAHYVYASNYYIILIHAVYDVPGKSSDGSEMFDASDSVYDYIICSICPVNLSKSGLSYDADTNSINERVRDWIVGAPANGFLFPAFNDRDTDIHSLLYFSKNPEELQTEFIENVFGAVAPMSAGNQKETFNTIISNTLGEECDFNTIKTIHETLNEMIEESKDEPEPLILTKQEVKHIFEESSVPDEKINMLEKQLTETVGEKPAFVASNITNVRKFNIETPDVVIKVNPERTDLIETRIIDGRQCLVIAVNDHIEVNGISVKAGVNMNSSVEENE